MIIIRFVARHQNRKSRRPSSGGVCG